MTQTGGGDRRRLPALRERFRTALGPGVHAATVPADTSSPRSRRSTIVHTMSVPMRRKLLIAIQASVTNPSFSNHGVVQGTVAEHELLSANDGTRSTSQW